ncbi:MAG TPA: 50S ribosomal protein L10 [Candidatus Methylomirabilis sp.]
MGRAEKGTSIAEFREKLSGVPGAVLTDFRGLSVADITELRTLLRKSEVEYKVVKNTLARLAVKDTGLEGLAAYFEGPTAIAISRKDAVAASKVLTTWGKSRPTFTIKGGVIEGRVVGSAEIAELAAVPPREVLLARMAGALQAPITGLVRVLAVHLLGLACALDQVRQKKEGAAQLAPS